jgi:phosphate transport system ATP-binding protein
MRKPVVIDAPEFVGSTQATPNRSPVLRAQQLAVTTAERMIIAPIDFVIPPNQVFGILGPSGAGKSTLLKCLNRLIDLTPNLRVRGDVIFHGESIFSPGVDVDELRARIGMIFQQPVVFPKSIVENVVFGARHLRRLKVPEKMELAEKALREAALWNEVKDRLHDSGLRLSVGQQQRLCLARTLALNPEVVLMDEPTSALDPRSTAAIEELMLRLKERRTIVLVTHNLAQADRVCDERMEVKPAPET